MWCEGVSVSVVCVVCEVGMGIIIIQGVVSFKTVQHTHTHYYYYRAAVEFSGRLAAVTGAHD